MTAPTRPVMRYHGSKWRIAPWIISFFPAHRVYVEPFGGGASVLMRKERSEVEVYNDLDDDVVNVFRVLRDDQLAEELKRQLERTPYARSEWRDAHRVPDGADQVERARRTLVVACQGFGSAGHGRSDTNGFRVSVRKTTSPGKSWATHADHVTAWASRMRSVIVECQDAASLLPRVDSARTLFYLDPPYPLSTRSAVKARSRTLYRNEMSDDDHRRLAQCLRAVRGMVVLSGYTCDLYEHELFASWERHERPAIADRGVARTEVVWLNPACSSALARERNQHEFPMGVGA